MPKTLVTGAAVGVGRAIAQKLASQGHQLVIHYNESEQEAKALASELSAAILWGDFSTPEGVAAFNEALRPHKITHLINSVGTYFIGSAIETPSHEWYSLLQTNFHTPRELIIGQLETLQVVVNIGMAGTQRQKVNRYCPAYTLAKEGLWSLTCTLAKELGPRGIRVNMVAPAFLERSVDYPEDVAKSIPLGRLGKLKEVAEAVSWLLSEEANYLTGQRIDVSGGAML